MDEEESEALLGADDVEEETDNLLRVNEVDLLTTHRNLYWT